ncbi:MAG: alkaline shock response membrane anchor protein AmaP [Candidatus Omnitrophica bacterium]|nr:alkaline shock response membrane anchor protein AmaP [Candidatus Omnitrophota bacterium]
MRIFYKFIVFLYTLFFSLIGVALMMSGFYSQLTGGASFDVLVDLIKKNPNSHWILILSGVLSILVSLLLAGISFQRFQKEKTIGYSTNFGQVIISLSAIEDYIRRFAQHWGEIKDLRPDVTISRRGIEIQTKVTLWSTTNIPEAAERIQSTIKEQIQALLSGIDKPLLINIHVNKILRKELPKPSEDKQDLPFLR